MIYAIAHIRGGGELGEKWRLDGRMFKKMNTFNDFVDSAKWLVANKYTSADRLVIQGGIGRRPVDGSGRQSCRPKLSRGDRAGTFC